MGNRFGLILLGLLLSASLGAASPALAADGAPPPPVRGGGAAKKPSGAKKPGKAMPASKYRPPMASGSFGIRPMIGVWGELNVNNERWCCGVEGSKFVFGADLHLGDPTGLGFGVGLHLGAGDGDFVVQPLGEVTYRFDLGIGLPLIPWAGGGMSLKMALTDRFEMALTFRGVLGVEYYLTDKLALSTQLTLPDLGPLFVPYGTVVGTVEWSIGAHIRL